MTRNELTGKILAAKRAKGLTWKAIVAEIGGGSAVYPTAALMGQMKLRPEQAECAAHAVRARRARETLAAGDPLSRLAADRGADRPGDLPPL
jgi:cyanate lyase